MQLTKITDKGKKGRFYIGRSEILTIDWNRGGRPEFFAFNESRKVKEVNKDYFAQETVGENYKMIEEQLPSNIELYQSTKDDKGNFYFCFYQESIIHGFDHNANKFLEWGTDEIGKGHSIYDIDFQAPGFLWLAFPTGQTVTQVSISKQKETHKIGEYTWDGICDPLSYPESLFVKGKYLYISNMGNRKLLRFNNESQELELIKTFEEKLWQYGETDIGTFIITDTGIFEIIE